MMPCHKILAIYCIQVRDDATPIHEDHDLSVVSVSNGVDL